MRWEPPWGPQHRRTSLAQMQAQKERLRAAWAKVASEPDAPQEFILKSVYAPQNGAFLRLPAPESVGAGTGICAACEAAAREDDFNTPQKLDGGGEGFRLHGHEFQAGSFVLLDPDKVNEARGEARRARVKESVKGGRNKGLEAMGVGQIEAFFFAGGQKKRDASVPEKAMVRLFLRPEELEDGKERAYRAHLQEVGLRTHHRRP